MDPSISQSSFYRSQNTGSKGVIKDYEDAKARLKNRWECDRVKYMERISSEALRASTIADDEREKAVFEELSESMEKKKQTICTTYLCEERQYGSTASQNSSGKMFQTLHAIRMNDLVEFVDSENEKTTVLVHICQQKIRVCARLNEILAQVAIACPYLKIGSIEETGNRFKKEMLPILIVYRNGEVLESHVRIVDEVGHNFDFDDILSFFLDRKYINPSEIQSVD